MDPKRDLLAKYLELCSSLPERPSAISKLQELRAEAALAGVHPLEDFLTARIAFVAGDYHSAVASLEAALAEDPHFFLAHHLHGVCLGNLGRHEEALAASNKAIASFHPTDTILEGHLAKAMVNRGATLGELGRHEDSINACEEVIARFGHIDDPLLWEQVAKAMINRGVSFGELGLHQDEVAAYDEVIDRFGDAQQPALREQVAWAMVNRGIALGELGHWQEEIEAYDRVIAQFEGSDDPALCEVVAETHANRMGAMTRSGSEEDATPLRVFPDDESTDEPPEEAVPTAKPEPLDEPEPVDVAARAEKAEPQPSVCSTEQLIEQIHIAPGGIVLAVSGGGSLAISELLKIPGASRTVLEAVVPYSEQSLVAWLGSRPESFCSAEATRAMAMVAFQRAWQYSAGDLGTAGLACTASLATDRPKRGAHRIHVALQTAQRTVAWFLSLGKGHRSRAQEEQLASWLLLNVVAEARAVTDRLDLDLHRGELLEHSETIAPLAWQDLLFGRIETVCTGDAPVLAILSGAFNPLHVGHRRMAETAQRILDIPVVMELPIRNADKPPLDYYEIERRLGQFESSQQVCLSRAATFEEKSAVFPGATFLVGVDTLQRITDARFYGQDPAACLAALRRIADRGCHFLVFGRDMGSGFTRLKDLDLPDVLQSICREVPSDEFREDVSSTEIRQSGRW